MSEALRFSLSPPISEIYDRIRPTSHVIEKGVIWLRDERNSLVLKITLLALSIVASVGISTIGLSLLLTSPLLGKTLVFFPSFLWAGLFIVNSLLGRKVEKEKIQYCFESVQNLVGGSREYLKIPELNISLEIGLWSEASESDREENHGKGDDVNVREDDLIKESCQEDGFLVFACRLKPEYLQEPLMRWKDFMGRRFLSFKLLDRENSKTFVFTLCETSKFDFQRFRKSCHWVSTTSDERIFDPPLTMADLHKIVMTDNHPKYALAR